MPERGGPVQSGLLYGTGGELADAVAVVLCAAGFTVTDLDTDLGGTRSADLLATLGEQTCLIEVKSASSPAPERLVSALQRHLATWPELRPDQPVTCAALIVNRQHKLDPAHRARAVYRRREFVDALPFPVLAADVLFDWWRAQDWPAVRAAVLGGAHPGVASRPATARDRARAVQRRRRWRRLGST